MFRKRTQVLRGLMSSRYWRHAGVTTFEITVVAGLSAIVIAGSLPAINRQLEQFRLDTAAYAVASELQLAKIQALKKNTAVTMTVSYASSTWGIAGQSSRTLSRTISFTSQSASSVTFDSRGYSTSPGALVITLNNSQNQSRTVTVQASGRITVT